MSILSQAGRAHNGQGALAASPISVYYATVDGRFIHRRDVADDAELANFLASVHAEHRGRAGFYVTEDGETYRVLFLRDACQFSRKYVAERIVPLFHRARRLAAMPPVKVPSRRVRKNLIGRRSA